MKATDNTRGPVVEYQPPHDLAAASQTMTDRSNGPWAEQYFNEMKQLQTRRTDAHLVGMPALRRLMKVALDDTGQSRVVGCFLLGLYNGPDYPFQLTDLRSLDMALHIDCLAVLAMDWTPVHEIHELVPHGTQIFRELVQRWGNN